MDAVESFSRQMLVIDDVVIAQIGMQHFAVSTSDEYHQIGVGELEVVDIALDFSQQPQ